MKAHGSSGAPDAPNESVLFKATAPARAQSPETFRQSLMIVIAFAATCLSGYYTVALDGTAPPRLVMAALFAGWLTLLGHSFRGMAPTRYIPG